MNSMTTTELEKEAKRPWAHDRDPRVSCPYRFGVGLDIGRISERDWWPMSGTSLGQSLMHFIIGSGQLFADSRDYPFQTFCRNDVFAIKSDWNAVSNDFWQGIRTIANLNDAIRAITQNYQSSEMKKINDLIAEDLKKLTQCVQSEKQLDLFQDTKA